MKKTLLILTSMICATIAVNAQFRFAPEIGMKHSFTNYSDNADIMYIPFGSTLIHSSDDWMPHIGVNVSYPVFKKYLNVTSGVFWNTAHSTNALLKPNTAYEYSWIKLHQITIPLNVTLKLPMKRNELFLSVGPYLTSFLSAKETRISRGFDQQYKLDENVDMIIGKFDEGASVKRMDAGANINFGFGHRTGLQVKVSYHMSFVDPINLPADRTVVYQRNALTFSVAYQL